MNVSEKNDLIDKLERASDTLERIIVNETPDSLRHKPQPEKWSALEVMCHLRDAEKMVFLNRIKRIRKEQNPTIEGMDQEAMAAEGDYLNQDPVKVLNRFRVLRKQTLLQLQNSHIEEWDRTYVHPMRGEETFGEMIRHFVAHDKKHLSQIRTAISDYLREHPDAMEVVPADPRVADRPS